MPRQQSISKAARPGRCRLAIDAMTVKSAKAHAKQCNEIARIAATLSPTNNEMLLDLERRGIDNEIERVQLRGFAKRLELRARKSLGEPESESNSNSDDDSDDDAKGKRKEARSKRQRRGSRQPDDSDDDKDGEFVAAPKRKKGKSKGSKASDKTSGDSDIEVVAPSKGRKSRSEKGIRKRSRASDDAESSDDSDAEGIAKSKSNKGAGKRERVSNDFSGNDDSSDEEAEVAAGTKRKKGNSEKVGASNPAKVNASSSTQPIKMESLQQAMIVGSLAHLELLFASRTSAKAKAAVEEIDTAAHVAELKSRVLKRFAAAETLNQALAIKERATNALKQTLTAEDGGVAGGGGGSKP